MESHGDVLRWSLGSGPAQPPAFASPHLECSPERRLQRCPGDLAVALHGRGRRRSTARRLTKLVAAVRMKNPSHVGRNGSRKSKRLPVVEPCYSRAANWSTPLTNSARRTLRRRDGGQQGVEPSSSWRANHDGLETERRTETEVLRNTSAGRGDAQSTNGQARQWKEVGWLPGQDSNIRPIG